VPTVSSDRVTRHYTEYCVSSTIESLFTAYETIIKKKAFMCEKVVFLVFLVLLVWEDSFTLIVCQPLTWMTKE